MAEPPSLGAENATLTCVLPAVPVGALGVLGAVAPAEGVTLLLALEALELPLAFVATTVNV